MVIEVQKIEKLKVVPATTTKEVPKMKENCPEMKNLQEPSGIS